MNWNNSYLCDYLVKASKILYGLSMKRCMKFAYELAKANNINIPPSWKENKSAGYEWMLSFRKRHPQLSLRKPEATSLARATAFNPTTVNEFFDNLEWAFGKLKQIAGDIRWDAVYNLDETGLTNVQNTQNLFCYTVPWYLGTVQQKRSLF